MMRRRLVINILLISALWGFLSLVGCDQTLVRDDLEAIQARGELLLITRNNAACYYEAAHGPAGFEYELAKSFADYLGVRLRILVIEDEVKMVETLLNGEADLIAAGQPFGRASARLLALGPGYMEVSSQVIGRRGGPLVNAASDLVDNQVWIPANSASIDQLKRISKDFSNLDWKVSSEFSSEDILNLVWNSSVPLTIAESNTVAINRRIYPELVVHFELGKPQQLRWAINPKNRHLLRAAKLWFARPATKTVIEGLISHYYRHLEDFDYVDLVHYRRRISDRLPQYQDYFEQAAEQYGLDWQLVAAQAYQESHWNPRAKSFTGVRGIMMLTLETARTLGLTDRTSVKEAIFAGTRYLARLRRLIGESVPEPDRTLMALAAYNIGFGHLQDARDLARDLGKPSDSWRGIRDILPLLQKKSYYQNLTHGYARGSEAVAYVDRIRTYHKFLNTACAPQGLTRVGG